MADGLKVSNNKYPCCRVKTGIKFGTGLYEIGDTLTNRQCKLCGRFYDIQIAESGSNIFIGARLDFIMLTGPGGREFDE